MLKKKVQYKVMNCVNFCTLLTLCLYSSCPTVDTLTETCTQTQPSLATDELLWQKVPESIINVEWTYGQKTCSSLSTCYQTDVRDDTILVPQIMPLEIQQDQKIRFIPSQSMGVPFIMQALYVGREAFEDCNAAYSLPVMANPTKEPHLIGQKFLPLGSNYFIVASSDPYLKCEFGLRLNITVKANDCRPPSQLMCNDQGHCLSKVLQPTFSCRCCKGWNGNHCDDIDACQSTPCLNGGHCYDVLGDPSGKNFSCQCSLGFYGSVCQHQHSNLCDLKLCRNNANCTGNSTVYMCSCPEGYGGSNCEIKLGGMCQPNPCKHGLCVEDGSGSYQCYCLPGYGGVQCEKDYNECQSGPCQHAGTCHDEENGFHCVCTKGYTGTKCNQKVDLCSHSPCVNGGQCVDFGDNNGCTCQPGFTGQHCESHITKCLPSSCHNGGTCIETANGYICQCLPDWIGKQCDEEVVVQTETIKPPSIRSRLEKSMKSETLAIVLSLVTIVIMLAFCLLGFMYYRKNNSQYRNRKVSPMFDFDGGEPVSQNAMYEASSVDCDVNLLNVPIDNRLRSRKV